MVNTELFPIIQLPSVSALFLLVATFIIFAGVFNLKLIYLLLYFICLQLLLSDTFKFSFNEVVCLHPLQLRFSICRLCSNLTLMISTCRLRNLHTRNEWTSFHVHVSFIHTSMPRCFVSIGKMLKLLSIFFLRLHKPFILFLLPLRISLFLRIFGGKNSVLVLLVFKINFKLEVFQSFFALFLMKEKLTQHFWLLFFSLIRFLYLILHYGIPSVPFFLALRKEVRRVVMQINFISTHVERRKVFSSQVWSCSRP